MNKMLDMIEVMRTVYRWKDAGMLPKRLSMLTTNDLLFIKKSEEPFAETGAGRWGITEGDKEYHREIIQMIDIELQRRRVIT